MPSLAIGQAHETIGQIFKTACLNVEEKFDAHLRFLRVAPVAVPPTAALDLPLPEPGRDAGDRRPGVIFCKRTKAKKMDLS